MNINMVMVFVFILFTATIATAGDVYRWTDPGTGKVLVTTTPPLYPVKEQRTAGKLPNGDMIDLVFDQNAPEIKVLVEKRKAREAEQKRIAEEQARQRFAREEEEIRIAAEKEKSERAIEQEKRRMAQEDEAKRIATHQKFEAENKRKEGSEKTNQTEEETNKLERKKPERTVAEPTKTTASADSIVSLINSMYGNVCHAEINGFFSKTLKLDWTANTKKIHAIKVLAEIGNVKSQLYEGGVRYFQFPNDAGTYNVIDWKTGEKKSVSDRTQYYFNN